MAKQQQEPEGEEGWVNGTVYQLDVSGNTDECIVIVHPDPPGPATAKCRVNPGWKHADLLVAALCIAFQTGCTCAFRYNLDPDPKHEGDYILDSLRMKT